LPSGQATKTSTKTKNYTQSYHLEPLRATKTLFIYYLFRIFQNFGNKNGSPAFAKQLLRNYKRTKNARQQKSKELLYSSPRPQTRTAAWDRKDTQREEWGQRDEGLGFQSDG
jgi:hypothetical protein